MPLRQLTLSLAMFALAVSTAWAQQVTIATPNTNVGDSFFEQMGVNFGFRINGGRPRFDDSGRSSVIGFNPFGAAAANNAIQINQGGFGNVQPQFGGFNPANQTTGGVQISGGNFTANLGFSLGQGSNRTLVSQTPMVTTMNGYPASFSDQIQQPFVTSVTPVVNGRLQHPRFGYSGPSVPMPRVQRVSPIYERYNRLVQQGKARPVGSADRAIDRAADRVAEAGRRPTTYRGRLAQASESSAGQGDLSVAEIRRRQAAADTAQDEAAMAFFERAVQAEKQGKRGVAKIFYRMAAEDATGSLRARAQARLQALSEPTDDSPGER